MRIGIPKEHTGHRVALTPAVAKKLIDQGATVLVESKAGTGAYFSDADYEAAGIEITDRATVLAADLVATIDPLPDAELAQLDKDTLVISQFRPFEDAAVAERLRELGLAAYSLDMIPRTSRAQGMDVLSSMAGVAGYRAVLTAAQLLPRFFPMLITAAGSIRPAKVLILGAGVAGLQAIATAKRLGAQVEASDVRQAAKEEVESLGAKFVEVEGARDDADAGGYAVEQTEDFMRRQREEVQRRAGKADVVITTAQVRGRKAPILLDADTVEQMPAGAVIVDLASSSGGNCALTKDNETIQVHGVTIVGNSALADTMPQDGSTLFANNLVNFIKLLIQDGKLVHNAEDDILEASLITATPLVPEGSGEEE
jgi:H+-translocating NAD(P) transhydrogenase subunit alpha